MKHAPFVFPLLALGLVACAGPAPDAVLLPDRAARAEDWSRFLPVLFPGLSACIAAHPSQPAFAEGVVPQNRGMILVRVIGADGKSLDCQAGSGGQPAPQLAPTEDWRQQGPSFTPANRPEPFAPCLLPEPVLARDGRLLGWLGYRRADCTDRGKAAP